MGKGKKERETRRIEGKKQIKMRKKWEKNLCPVSGPVETFSR